MIDSVQEVHYLLTLMWDNFFKRPLDTLKHYWSQTYEEIRQIFLNFHWYEVYDFIEFITNTYPDQRTNEKFMDYCNTVLESEVSAYRFVGGKITKITSEEEISEIEEALEASKPLVGVHIHLKSALDKLADRKSPDYRNSIKESISAVESICILITKNEKTTLGDALKKIDEKIQIHQSLKRAFNQLYGYTSDAEGIRHALLNEPNLDFEDAKFMLVSCSAFINYLSCKASKAGIKLQL